MNLTIKTRAAQSSAKQIILLMALFLTVQVTNAQRSMLLIGTLTNNELVGRDGSENYKGGISSTTASLRKEIVRDKIDNKNILPEASKDKPIPTDMQKNGTPKIIVAPVLTTIGTIYDIPGNTATNQYSSLQANFKFFFYNGNTRSSGSPAGLVELYKLEKGPNTRSFCIPSGGCASVNIPIQITANGQAVVPEATTGGGGRASGKSPLYLVILPNGGYLQPGEYAFIDKSSLKQDGTALLCFTFTVKQ